MQVCKQDDMIPNEEAKASGCRRWRDQTAQNQINGEFGSLISLPIKTNRAGRIAGPVERGRMTGPAGAEQEPGSADLSRKERTGLGGNGRMLARQRSRAIRRLTVHRSMIEP